MKRFDLLDLALVLQALAMLLGLTPILALVGVVAATWSFSIVGYCLLFGWPPAGALILLSILCDKLWMDKNFPR